MNNTGLSYQTGDWDARGCSNALGRGEEFRLFLFFVKYPDVTFVFRVSFEEHAGWNTFRFSDHVYWRLTTKRECVKLWCDDDDDVEDDDDDEETQRLRTTPFESWFLVAVFEWTGTSMNCIVCVFKCILQISDHDAPVWFSGSSLFLFYSAYLYRNHSDACAVSRRPWNTFHIKSVVFSFLFVCIHGLIPQCKYLFINETYTVVDTMVVLWYGYCKYCKYYLYLLKCMTFWGVFLNEVGVTFYIVNTDAMRMVNKYKINCNESNNKTKIEMMWKNISRSLWNQILSQRL